MPRSMKKQATIWENPMMNSLEREADKTLGVLLASCREERLAQLAMGLWTLASCAVHRAESGAEVLARLMEGGTDLLVIDEQLTDITGIELAREVARCHPFVDCIMVDNCEPADFHVKTEGLGILMQLPSPPQMADAKSILGHLRVIRDIGNEHEGAMGRDA